MVFSINGRSPYFLTGLNSCVRRRNMRGEALTWDGLIASALRVSDLPFY